MGDIIVTPQGNVATGKDKYTFTERQGEADVSGVKNYPNEITISVNQDIAWQIVNDILKQLRYRPSDQSFDLIIYGQLAEKAEV